MLWKLKKLLILRYWYFYTMLYGMTHKIEKKVLFISYRGKQYSCNPRAVSEKMHELYPDYKIVWMLESNMDKYKIIPDYCEIVIGNDHSRAYYQQLATCSCVVTNEQFEIDTYKRKSQFFVQTWHGDRGFKKILNQVWKEKKRPVKIVDNKVTDIAVSGSSKYCGEEMYRSAFLYNGTLLKVGSPRNDKLLNGISDNELGVIKKRLNIKSGTKVLLYAPTFRDSNRDNQKINVDLQNVMQALEKNGDEWICLVRAHSSCSGLFFSNDLNLRDVTDYPDMTDLLLIADFLITDYSSCCNDYALTSKPVILTIYDKDEYEANCRGFTVKPEDVGFFIARNNEELIQMIMCLSNDEYSSRDHIALDYYGTYETGNAAESVCNAINAFIMKHNN